MALQTSAEGNNTIVTAPAVHSALEHLEDTRKVVSVQLRIDYNHRRLLDYCAEKRNGDRADTLRYAIRLLYAALNSENAEIIVTDKQGKQVHIQVIKDGVPI